MEGDGYYLILTPYLRPIVLDLMREGRQLRKASFPKMTSPLGKKPRALGMSLLMRDDGIIEPLVTAAMSFVTSGVSIPSS